MKPVDQWGADEYVTAGLIALFCYGVWRAATLWWHHHGPAWLQAHHVLLAPGKGILDAGSVGSLDLPRILAAAAVIFLLWMSGRAMVLPTIAREQARREAQRDKARRTAQDM